MARGKAKITRNIVVVALFAVFTFMLLRWFEHSQVYHPTVRHDAAPDILGRPFEEVFLGETPKIHGWFFPADPTSPRKDVAVLVCHGNGGNISHRLDSVEALLETGVSVMLFDYRGYGRSTGRPSEEGTYADAQAAYKWLKNKGFSGEDIVALGESLGGAIATELAVRETVRGLVLQSTFTCIPDIGTELFSWLPVRRVCSIFYDTYKKLPGLKIPVAVMHSRADTLIRFHHAEKNFALLNEPKLFVELKGDHNETLAAGRQEFVNGIERFLQMTETIVRK